MIIISCLLMFKEVNKYLDKVDDVKKMLDGLMSKDEEQVGGLSHLFSCIQF